MSERTPKEKYLLADLENSILSIQGTATFVNVAKCKMVRPSSLLFGLISADIMRRSLDCEEGGLLSSSQLEADLNHYLPEIEYADLKSGSNSFEIVCQISADDESIGDGVSITCSSVFTKSYFRCE